MPIHPSDIELNDELRRQLAALAEQSGRPWQEIITEALNGLHYRHQSHHADESALDILKRQNLVGCIENTPSDLSVNPKYMEGFGEDDYQPGAC